MTSASSQNLPSALWILCTRHPGFGGLRRIRRAVGTLYYCGLWYLVIILVVLTDDAGIQSEKLGCKIEAGWLQLPELVGQVYG